MRKWVGGRKGERTREHKRMRVRERARITTTLILKNFPGIRAAGRRTKMALFPACPNRNWMTTQQRWKGLMKDWTC